MLLVVLPGFIDLTNIVEDRSLKSIPIIAVPASLAFGYAILAVSQVKC